MDGLGRILSCGNFVEIAGEAALMRPLTIGLLSVCENHLLSLRRTPLDVARSLPDSEVASELSRRAVEDLRRDRSWRFITCEALQEWIYTRDGIAFTAWLCLRGRHTLATSPSALRDRFLDNPSDRDQFVRRRDVCSGIDLLASLDWEELPHPFPERQKKPVRPARLPWRKMIRDAAEGIHRLPSDLAGLTLYALRILTTEANDPSLAGSVSVSAEDARKMQGMGAEDRRAYLASLREGV